MWVYIEHQNIEFLEDNIYLKASTDTWILGWFLPHSFPIVLENTFRTFLFYTVYLSFGWIHRASEFVQLLNRGLAWKNSIVLHICTSFGKTWEFLINQKIVRTIHISLPWDCVVYVLCNLVKSKGCTERWRCSESLMLQRVFTNINTTKPFYSIIWHPHLLEEWRLYVS